MIPDDEDRQAGAPTRLSAEQPINDAEAKGLENDTASVLRLIVLLGDVWISIGIAIGSLIRPVSFAKNLMDFAETPRSDRSRVGFLAAASYGNGPDADVK